jgi:hypothetical protein
MKKMLASFLFFIALNPHYMAPMQQVLEKKPEATQQHPHVHSALTRMLTQQSSIIIGKHRTASQRSEKKSPVLKNVTHAASLPFKSGLLLKSDKLKQKAIRGIVLTLELADQKKRFSGELFDMEID